MADDSKTLSDIAAINQKNLAEQNKQTSFLRDFVKSMKIQLDFTKGEAAEARKRAAADRLEKVEKERDARIQKRADRMNMTFGDRFKEFSNSIKNLTKGMSNKGLPKILKNVLFGAAVLTALRFVYQNWNTIKETYEKMKPFLEKLKTTAIGVKDTFNDLGIGLDDVVLTLGVAWVSIKAWSATTTIVAVAARLIGIIGAVSKALLVAGNWMLFGSAAGAGSAAAGTAGAAGGGKNKLVSSLKSSAKTFGKRLALLPGIFGVMSRALIAGSVSLAASLGIGAVGAGGLGLAAGATVGILAYLGISTIVGLFNTIKQVGDELNKAESDKERQRVWLRSTTIFNARVTDAVVWPFQWATARAMELSGADPGTVLRFENFSLGDYMFEHKPGTFSYQMGEYMASGMNWFRGRTKEMAAKDNTFGFKTRMELFVQDMKLIPTRLRNSLRDTMVEANIGLKAGFTKFGVYLKQLPDRALLTAQSLVPGMETRVAMGRLKLDMELAEAYRTAEEEARYGIAKNKMRSAAASKFYTMGTALQRQTTIRDEQIRIENKKIEQGNDLLELQKINNEIMLKSAEFLRAINDEGRRRFAGTTQVNNFTHPDVKQTRHGYYGGVVGRVY